VEEISRTLTMWIARYLHFRSKENCFGGPSLTRFSGFEYSILLKIFALPVLNIE